MIDFADKSKFLILPPAKRIIYIGGERLYLPFPYMVFWQRQQCSEYLFAMMSNRYPVDVDDLRLVPLPNIRTDGSVCLGKFDEKTSSLQEKVTEFWRSEFRLGLGWPSEEYMNRRQIKEWAKITDATQVEWHRPIIRLLHENCI
jgi:hypothetical protein